MKLAFSHMLEMVSADAQVVLDVAVEWPAAGPRLRIDDVLDTSGKVSLIRSDNRLDREIAGFMADEAEKCPRLLADAIAQWDDEREAA